MIGFFIWSSDDRYLFIFSSSFGNEGKTISPPYDYRVVNGRHSDSNKRITERDLPKDRTVVILSISLGY